MNITYINLNEAWCEILPFQESDHVLRSKPDEIDMKINVKRPPWY